MFTLLEYLTLCDTETQQTRGKAATTHYSGAELRGMLWCTECRVLPSLPSLGVTCHTHQIQAPQSWPKMEKIHVNGNNEISRIRFIQSLTETESIYSGNVIVCKKTNHQDAWIITSWMCPLNDLVKTQSLAALCHRQWLCRVQFCCCVLFSIDMTAHLSSWDAFRKNKQVLTRYIWKSIKF